ncbi:thiamine pyrophosphate-dependent enzyme [Streptomyces lunaelactis]|uniref:thiamine pyrophosphate-dependent enzyme n=1 Tax=Streptomyces lunaelactis TaxID=1535768 RepID=UPI0020C78DAD|nr:thiamine pyrophosphate-dependent enzyme [Streptomyces lunaelactis]
MSELPTEPVPLTGGEAVVRALAAHGVTQAFGIPGTHNLEIYRHLAAYGVAHVTPRHEQGAGYAADAYARVSGRPGVAITTTGPALLNIAAAVGQAYSDSVPLLVVSPGMPLRHPRQPTGLLHEMRSQTEALRGVAAFSHRVSAVEEIAAALARAFTLFTTGRPRPVHIEIPLDLLEAAEPVGRVRIAPQAGPALPAPAELRRAADALRAASRPALVLGGGAREAAAELLALAEELAAPVVTTANGKGIVDESHPLSLGVSLHSPAVQKWLADRDVVLAVGTELAESDLWSAPPELSGTLVRVDVDPAQMYAEVPADVALVGDARQSLRELLAAYRSRGPLGGGAGRQGTAEPRVAREGETRAVPPRAAELRLVRDTGPGDGDARAEALASAREAVTELRLARDAHAEALAGAHRGVAGLRRERDAETRDRDARWLPYLAAIRATLDTDAVITSDSAQCCYYGAIPHLPVAPDGRYLHPTGFGTLGYALPAAIGAKTAAPDRQVIALSGDGGLQFSVQDLATAAQLQLPLPVVVFDNGGYGEIRDEMTARGDAPAAVDLAPVDLPALARAYGGHGEHATTPEALAAALARALTTPGPTVITVPEETAR